jgi:hypothetical protein
MVLISSDFNVRVTMDIAERYFGMIWRQDYVVRNAFFISMYYVTSVRVIDLLHFDDVCDAICFEIVNAHASSSGSIVDMSNMYHDSALFPGSTTTHFHIRICQYFILLPCRLWSLFNLLLCES